MGGCLYFWIKCSNNFRQGCFLKQRNENSENPNTVRQRINFCFMAAKLNYHWRVKNKTKKKNTQKNPHKPKTTTQHIKTRFARTSILCCCQTPAVLWKGLVESSHCSSSTQGEINTCRIIQVLVIAGSWHFCLQVKWQSVMSWQVYFFWKPPNVFLLLF